MKRRQDEGFTLIELLIVIVILGILAAVTVFAVTGIRDQGQSNACDIEERTLVTAAEAYFAENNDYPADATELSAQLSPGSSDWSSRFNATFDSTGATAPTFTGTGTCG